MVFSNPEVVRRVNADFVPVALKAERVNIPGDDAESRLYAAIGRSKPAPQGICVADPDGVALAWTLAFDDEKAILAFLDRARTPREKVERYEKFPSARLPDAERSVAAVPEPHREPSECPGRLLVRPGTVVAKLVGRALDKDGVLAADTSSQERYVEDRFEVPREVQDALLALGPGRARVPEAFARLLADHAHLGELDVRPLSTPVPGQVGRLEVADLFVERVEGGLRLGGKTVAVAKGPGYHHRIELSWEGAIRASAGRVTGLVLVARGQERLENKDPRFEPGKERDVEHLRAGRPLDIDTPVRFGIRGEAAPASETSTEDRHPLRSRIARLQAAVHKARAEGRDLQPIARVMEGLEGHMSAGRIEEATAVLDRAIALAEGKTAPAGEDAIRSRLERIHRRVEELLRAGKRDVAAAALDRAIEAMR